jgi:hypothetical protein
MAGSMDRPAAAKAFRRFGSEATNSLDEVLGGVGKNLCLKRLQSSTGLLD